MRLIHASRLEMRDFYDQQIPSYAILSHCWGSEEVTLSQFEAGTCDRGGSGYQKIVQCCRLAQSHGLDWVWVDTCCIDKSSSAELSESINLMYAWYCQAATCYAFLSDFNSAGSHQSMASHNYSATSDGNSTPRMKACRWFSRGWTLQELVAPKSILFYDAAGHQFGTKESLADELAAITGIDRSILLHQRPLPEASIACRMSWASARTTTRPEDIAYCLLGIFNVNMPLLYGEGSKRAFTRLQECILQQTDDETIFAWRAASNDYLRGLFAEHPSEFAASRDIYPLRRVTRIPAPRLTSRGIQFSLAKAWIVDIYRYAWFRSPLSDWLQSGLCIELACQCPGPPGSRLRKRVISIRLRQRLSTTTAHGSYQFYRCDAAELIVRERVFLLWFEALTVYGTDSVNVYQPASGIVAAANAPAVAARVDGEHKTPSRSWSELVATLAHDAVGCLLAIGVPILAVYLARIRPDDPVLIWTVLSAGFFTIPNSLTFWKWVFFVAALVGTLYERSRDGTA